MKKKFGLQAKILFFFTVFIFTLCTVITVVSVQRSMSVASSIFAREAESILQSASAVINGDRFEALNRTLDINDPFYEQVRLELFNLWQDFSMYYLYTAAPDQRGNYRYIIDGSGEPGSDSFSDMGDLLDDEDMDSAFVKTWRTKTGQLSSMHRTEWGHLISVYEPIFNSRREMVGIIGCDFDAEFLYASVRTQIIEQALLAILFAAAGVGIMFFFMRLIFGRMDNIRRILAVIAKGEGDLSTRINVKGNDEVDSIADLFNKTLDRICEMIILVKDQTVSLSGVGNDLLENMNNTAKAVTEITDNILKIKGQVVNQSASVTETNATMEQVTENIKRLDKQVEEQTENVSRSSSAVEQMLANIQSVTATLVKNTENVEQLISASDTGRNSLEEVSRDIQEIAKESEGILEINQVMQNIASQTNLLSMNAAIEAAHAGETGKGFAVVAEEIRKLAESSNTQSKTISSVLKKIKSSIDKISKSTAVVLDKFKDIDQEVRTVAEQEANIRSSMEEQSTGSKQILESIGKLQESTKEVKEGSQAMLEGSRQVIKEGENLAAVTAELSEGINQIASGADFIKSAVWRVNGLSDNTKQHIAALSGEVDRFKVQAAVEYSFDKIYEIGYSYIDDQHRQLFGAINSIIRACNSGSREDFEKNVLFLGSYVEKHFFDEEEIQKKHNYPDYPNHKELHLDLKDAVNNYASQWLAAGPSDSVLREVRSHLVNKIVDHIKSQDIKLGEHLNRKRSY